MCYTCQSISIFQEHTCTTVLLVLQQVDLFHEPHWLSATALSTLSMFMTVVIHGSKLCSKKFLTFVTIVILRNHMEI